MTRKIIAAVAAAIIVAGGVAVAAQDKYTLKAPNGVAFSEFRGYETWSYVASSETDHGIKVIAANPTMISAYRAGVPGNGHPFPDGAMIAKIEWTKRPNPQSPYAVRVPGTLKSVSFIEKDSRRFPESSGWGYAQFLYDAKTGTFTPYGKDANFGKDVCYACHTAVAVKDYIFTAYPFR